MADKPQVPLGPAAVLLKWITVQFDHLLPWVTSPWFLVIAILMDLQYYHPRFGWGQLRTLAKEIMVLQIYYCPAWGASASEANHLAFVASCIFLFVDEVIVYNLASHCALQCSGNKLLELDHAKMLCHFEKIKLEQPLLDQPLLPIDCDPEEAVRTVENTLVKRKDKRDTAHNVYMDFRQPMRKVFVVFFAQFGLVLYYIFEMNGGDTDDGAPGTDSRDPRNVSLVKWMFAVATIIIAGESETGPVCDLAFWRHQWKKASENLTKKEKFEFLKQYDWVEGGVYKTIQYYLWGPMARLVYRFVCDASINSLARSVIRGTAPIMLCVEGPLDFVKDVTALFFIIKLDDIEKEVDLTNEEEWKDINDAEEAADRFFCCEEADQLRKLLEFPDRSKVVSLFYKDAKDAENAAKNAAVPNDGGDS